MSQNLLQGLQAGYLQTTLFEYYTMQIENRYRLVGNFFASATFFRPLKSLTAQNSSGKAALSVHKNRGNLENI